MGQPFECAVCKMPLTGWNETYYTVVHMRESPHKGLPIDQINLCGGCVEKLLPAGDE